MPTTKYFILTLTLVLFLLPGCRQEKTVNDLENSDQGLQEKLISTTDSAKEHTDPRISLGIEAKLPLSAESYSFIYFPVDEEEGFLKDEQKKLESNQNMSLGSTIIGSPISYYHISFSLYELFTKKLIEKNNIESTDIFYAPHVKNGLFIFNYLDDKSNFSTMTYEEISNFLQANWNREKLQVEGRAVFIESLNDTACLYFLERITDEFVVFYSGCEKKNEIQKIHLLDTKELKKELLNLESERLEKMKGQAEMKSKDNYYAFQGGIRVYNFSQKREEILATIDPFPLNFPQTYSSLDTCTQILEAPVLSCQRSGYNESDKLFFIQSKKFEEMNDCFMDSSEDLSIVGKTLIIDCEEMQKGPSRFYKRIYDFEGNVLKENKDI